MLIRSGETYTTCIECHHAVASHTWIGCWEGWTAGVALRLLAGLGGGDGACKCKQSHDNPTAGRVLWRVGGGQADRSRPAASPVSEEER